MLSLYSQSDKDEILGKICKFINVKCPILYSNDFKDNIRQICVQKVCNVIGIRCTCNYTNAFMSFFSDIAGEAVVETFGLKFHIASEELRFFTYNHVNLVDSGYNMLQQEDKDEAFLDMFKLADDFKYIKGL